MFRVYNGPLKLPILSFTQSHHKYSYNHNCIGVGWSNLALPSRKLLCYIRAQLTHLLTTYSEPQSQQQSLSLSFFASLILLLLLVRHYVLLYCQNASLDVASLSRIGVWWQQPYRQQSVSLLPSRVGFIFQGKALKQSIRQVLIIKYSALYLVACANV